MKTFKQYLMETFRSEAVPAIKHPSGKVYRGKRGEDHSEIRMRCMTEPGKPLEGVAGYFHRKSGFTSKSEMGGMDSTRLLNPREREAREKRRGYGSTENAFDTTDRMTDLQRMRKYGTFEE